MKIERSELVRMAQMKLEQVIEILEVACEGDSHSEAYLLDHLKIRCSAGHSYLSRDLNLTDLIEKYENTDPDDDEVYEDVEVDCGWLEQMEEGL